MVANSGSAGDENRSEGGNPGGVALKKGPWTAAEDAILVEYVTKNGEGNWNTVQKNSGLARCGKSCRLRWANHLRPNLKKGSFSPEEERLILELHAKLGNKWARMAAQVPWSLSVSAIFSLFLFYSIYFFCIFFFAVLVRSISLIIWIFIGSDPVLYSSFFPPPCVPLALVWLLRKWRKRQKVQCNCLFWVSVNRDFRLNRVEDLEVEGIEIQNFHSVSRWPNGAAASSILFSFDTDIHLQFLFSSPNLLRNQHKYG